MKQKEIFIFFFINLHQWKTEADKSNFFGRYDPDFKEN